MKPELMMREGRQRLPEQEEKDYLSPGDLIKFTVKCFWMIINTNSSGGEERAEPKGRSLALSWPKNKSLLSHD